MSKKNTVSVALEQEDYDALKALAEEQDRYISGQARHMLRKALTPARCLVQAEPEQGASEAQQALNAKPVQEPVPG